MLPSRPATAQDYLEKIFQIPFLLQPLKDDGFRRLVHGLTAGGVVAETTADTETGTATGREPRRAAHAAVEPLSGEAVEWQQLCAMLLRLSESDFPGKRAAGADFPGHSGVACQNCRPIRHVNSARWIASTKVNHGESDRKSVV